MPRVCSCCTSRSGGQRLALPGAACWGGRSSALACRSPGLPCRRRQSGPTTHCLHPPRGCRTMDIFQAILATLGSEFSDVPDVEQAVRVALLVLLAALLGWVVRFD